MKHIEATYSSYKPVIDFFGKEKIQERIGEFLYETGEFLELVDPQKNNLRVDDALLVHTVMDYFTDVMRLKQFHPIERINEYKILAYELFWWLRRKPIQIVGNCSEDYVFVNEKFAVSKIIVFLQDEILCTTEEGKRALKSLYDSLYYYFKYRHFTAQDIELILLAYKAGNYCDMNALTKTATNEMMN